MSKIVHQSKYLKDIETIPQILEKFLLEWSGRIDSLHTSGYDVHPLNSIVKALHEAYEMNSIKSIHFGER